MRIVKLEAENVLRLKAVSITPKGDVVIISGANGAGKSSVLNSIFMALGGKSAIPSKPVRKGQDSAIIRLNLGEVRVTRKFAANGNTEVVVEAESGARFPSPQRMLDELLGELSFDPLRFATAEPKAQLETLRRLVPLEVDVDALDGQNARDYEQRAAHNKAILSLRERVTTLAAGVEEFADVTPIDVSELTARMTEAFDHNSASKRARQQKSQAAAKVAQLTDDYDRLVAAAAEAQRRASIARDALGIAIQVNDRLPEPEALVDVTDIRDQINEASRENTRRDAQRSQREKLAVAEADLAKTKQMSANVTERMEARSQQKRDAIAAAKMPVAGLSFGDGQVLYNDLPFDQASSAEQLKVSFAIACSANPKLKIVLIRDGSLLDEKNLAALGELAEQYGTQVWLERVDSSGRIGIVIEDGSVAAVDGVPVEAIPKRSYSS